MSPASSSESSLAPILTLSLKEGDIVGTWEEMNGTAPFAEVLFPIFLFSASIQG